MSTLSVTDLEKYLKEYSVSLEYWSSDMGDSHEMLGAREILEANKQYLSEDQLTLLSTLDNQAKRILDHYKSDETWDVKMLRETVAISHREYASAA